ncbi:hypothetical protein V8C86DRAFT_2750890 [Haematococcus lacustris]
MDSSTLAKVDVTSRHSTTLDAVAAPPPPTPAAPAPADTGWSPERASGLPPSTRLAARAVSSGAGVEKVGEAGDPSAENTRTVRGWPSSPNRRRKGERGDRAARADAGSAAWADGCSWGLGRLVEEGSRRGGPAGQVLSRGSSDLSPETPGLAGVGVAASAMGGVGAVASRVLSAADAARQVKSMVLLQAAAGPAVAWVPAAVAAWPSPAPSAPCFVVLAPACTAGEQPWRSSTLQAVWTTPVAALLAAAVGTVAAAASRAA